MEEPANAERVDRSGGGCRHGRGGRGECAAVSARQPRCRRGRHDQGRAGVPGLGCSGGNISPALNWAGAPPGTKSFALTLFDPDAGGGKGWWHWLIFDIPPDTAALPKGAGNPRGQAAPKGSVQSRTDFGSAGYGGPCPPPGERPHRYVFTIYALDLDRPKATKETAPEVVGADLRGHSIGRADLTGLYGR